MLRSRFLVFMVSIVAIAATVGAVFGQDYPAKPIRLVTAAAGGGSDFSARIVAQGISAPLGQPVIVDNRTALLATDAVSKSVPDGYTLLVNGSSVWILPFLQKVPYDVVRDFAPVVQTSRDVKVVVVHPSLPVRSIKELIALAKARPGELNYSSGGVGTPNHLAAELFNSMAAVKTVHIPYKGGTLGMVALIAGEVQLMIVDAGTAMPHVKSEKVRALAVGNAEPSAMLPGLPTVSASGLPGYELLGATGVWAPAKTPAAIVLRLNQEMVRVLNTPEVKERYLSIREETVAGPPEQFAASISADMARTGRVIKEAGIKID